MDGLVLEDLVVLVSLAEDHDDVVRLCELDGAEDRLAAELADVVIATSDNPRTEDPEFILSQVEEGVDEAIGTKHHELIVDRRQAIYRAVEMAEKDDIVVILGKGHENYQILKDKTMHFDDKEEARAAVAAKLAEKN